MKIITFYQVLAIMCLNIQLLNAQGLEAPETNYGKITLEGGKIIEGSLKFYDESRLAFLEKDGTTFYLTPTEVTRFEFYDRHLSYIRTFIRLKYNLYSHGVTQYLFFEVIKELKSFSVLSKIERLRTQQKDPRLIRVPTSRFAPDKRIIAQSMQTILFLSNKDGRMKPYIQLIEQREQWLINDKDAYNGKFINKRLLKEYTGAYYKQLVSYAKECDLQLNNPYGIKKVLDYYEKILSTNLN
jgi:hypothetical protein